MSKLVFTIPFPSTMAPIRKEDIRVVHAEPLLQPLSSYGDRAKPISDAPAAVDPPSHQSSAPSSILDNDDPQTKHALHFIDRRVNQIVSLAMDKAAMNMDRALEGATVDKRVTEDRLWNLESEVRALRIGTIAGVGVGVAGAVGSIVWAWLRFLRGQERKGLEVKPESALRTRFIE
jgi:hypothetical protein